MRRRDFTIGLALAGAARTALALQPAKEHRTAIVIPAGPVTSISETGVRAWRAFFEELRRLGDVEGQNLTIERYSGEGRPEGLPSLPAGSSTGSRYFPIRASISGLFFCMNGSPASRGHPPRGA